MREPLHDVSLAPYTSYHIGGVAREVHFPETSGELLETLRAFDTSGTPYFILGMGTNVLVGDGYWDGAVLVTTKLDTVTVHDDHLTCGAGLASTQAAEIALDNAKTGLEFLYLLPGSIGGALAGNARYDDVSVSDVLMSTLAVHPEHGTRRFAAKDIDFAYKKTSILGEGWTICDVELMWQDDDPADIRHHMDIIQGFRDESHHFDHPSCGCVFKNDHAKNIQVGRLIDSLDLKGMRIGGAEIAGFHGNFIVNTGGATATDVLSLIETVERIVGEKNGTMLEREVHLVGTFTSIK